MSFERFFCDSLELQLRLSSGEIDRHGLIDAGTERGTTTEPDQDGDRWMSLSFGSSDKGANYHAHLRAFLEADESGTIDLCFYPGRLEDETGEPPYAEHCANWLDGFIKRDTLTAHLNVNYTFGKQFSPVIKLPFPLVTSEKALTGALVTGLGLFLPNEGASKTVIIQSAGDETYIFLRVDVEIDLKTFELFPELEKLSVIVNPLVKKQDNVNEPSRT